MGFLSALLLCIFTLAPLAQAAPAKKDAGQVIVYNWSEYIPQDVLDAFTQETGIKVVYSTFETNEAMYAKLKLLRGKGYDVVVPSGYFVQLMAQSKLLQPLDLKKVPNIANIDSAMRGLEFDPANRYSVPYMWGAAGLAYNKKYIPAPLSQWADLLRPEFKGKIILTDDLRDAFSLALRAKGVTINTREQEEIAKGFDFLSALKPSVRIFDVTAIKQALISEEVWLGPIWNGDFLVAKEENPDLEYVFPKEGAILWVDNFAIPSGAENVENAYTFINYMLRPEVAKRAIEEYKYSSPNREAIKLLPQEMRENRILNPGPEELKNAEFTAGVGEALSIYEKFWERLKTAR